MSTPSNTAIARSASLRPPASLFDCPTVETLFSQPVLNLMRLTDRDDHGIFLDPVSLFYDSFGQVRHPL